MELAIIVAKDLNGAIGKDNQLLWRLRDDLKFFKKTTLGKTLIMGRKTFDSIGKPLPGRKTIVISRNPNLSIEKCDVVDTLEKAIQLCEARNEEQAIIAGGGEIYSQALPFVSRIYLTVVNAQLDADTFFPSIDLTDWETVAHTSFDEGEGNQFPFDIYEYQIAR